MFAFGRRSDVFCQKPGGGVWHWIAVFFAGLISWHLAARVVEFSANMPECRLLPGFGRCSIQ